MRDNVTNATALYFGLIYEMDIVYEIYIVYEVNIIYEMDKFIHSARLLHGNPFFLESRLDEEV